MGNEQENRLLRRFFQHFQQAVRRLRIHFLGQIHHHALPASLDRGQGQLGQDGFCIGHIDTGRLSFNAQGFGQFLFREAGIAVHEFAPPRKELLTAQLAHGTAHF